MILDNSKVIFMKRLKANVILQSCFIEARYYCTCIQLETQLFFVEYDKETGKFKIH